MDIIRKDFRYKVVKNLLTKNELDIFTNYCRIRHRLNKTDFEGNLSDYPSTSIYGDYLMESLLLNKRKVIEENVGLKLLPTYSFWRMYTLGTGLSKHKDREACEISITVSLGSEDDKPWTFYVEGKPVDLEHGDGLIYLGVEDEHHRENLEKDWHAQCFLHYVDLNGKHANQYMDNRTMWGYKGGVK
jgi:hypothetical protein